MPIEKRQPGGAAAAAQAGTVVGAGQKAVRQEAQAEQARQQQMAIKAREKAQQTAMEWDLEKMRMNSMLDYQKETRGEIRAMEAGDVAHQRAVERIELSKDLDHQYKEQKRLRELGAVEAEQEALNEETDPATGHSSKNDFHIRMAQLKIDNRKRAIETDQPVERVTEADIMMQRFQSGGEPDAAGEVATLTDVGGFPLPVPAVYNLTAQHVHALKVQQNKAFVVDTHTNTLQQVPLKNEAESLKLARYEKPKIIGARVSKPKSKYPATGLGYEFGSNRFNF